MKTTPNSARPAHASKPAPKARRASPKAAAGTPKPAYWDVATRALAGSDRVLRKLIRKYPDVHLQRRSDPFTTLARAIVGQQISVKAAAAIWQRFCVLVASTPRKTAFPTLDATLVATRDLPTLRACGLSMRKAEYLRDLAQHFASGRLDPKQWKAMDDETLIDALVDVKGIGRWTAEMFLIFHELRADVLPLDDLGLRRAIAVHYNKGERMDVPAMRELAVSWQPYRSVATWYLWRSLDPIPVEY